MPEQQQTHQNPQESPSTDKPEHQQGTNMDGKFEETMHVSYKLMSKMVTPIGKML